MQHRILIVLEDGRFKGASSTTDTGSPVPLDAAALSAVFPDLNTAALARIEEMEVEHAAEIAALQSTRTAKPGEVTPRQIRLAMLQAGLDLVAITAMLSQNQAAFIEWEYAEVIRRDHPLVIQMGEALNISADQIDNLFALAGTL